VDFSNQFTSYDIRAILGADQHEEEEVPMDVYRSIYDFAAKAGSLEGYVYPKGVDVSYLPVWVDHVAERYKILPEEARNQFQDLLDGTVGRAVQSLITILGEDDPSIKKLKGIMKGELPASYDDFKRSG
jgi:hypothetical protein